MMTTQKTKTDQKSEHKDILLIRQGRYEYKRRMLVKHIHKIIPAEITECFTEYYKLQIIELKKEGKYEDALQMKSPFIKISKNWLEDMIITSKTKEEKKAYRACYNNSLDLESNNV